MPTAAPTIIESLAAWASALRLEDVPGRVVERTKLQALSVLASLYPGSACDGGRAVHGAVRAAHGDGPCTLLPRGERTTPEGALFAHAAYSMAYDFDDYLFMGHTGHSAILAPLALGEAGGSPGRAVLEAAIAANEIAGRVGASCLVGPQNGQAWSFIHAVGAAVAASKLLGLDAGRTADALGIALAQPNYMLFPGFFSPAKLLTASVPAVAGLQAARLAAAGLRGPRAILEAGGGFLRHFSFAPQGWVFGGLGTAWVTDTIAVKPVPGCAYIDSAVEALEVLLRRGIRAEDVAAVDVRAGKLTTTMERLGEVHAPEPGALRTTFSVRWSLATLLLHGRLTPREVARPDVARLAPLARIVELRHDPALTRRTLDALRARRLEPLAGLGLLDLVRIARLSRRLGPPLEIGPGDLRLAPALLRSLRSAPAELGDLDGFAFPFPAEVTVRLRGGSAERALVEVPRGAPGGPLAETRDVVLGKLRREAGPALGAERLAALIERVDALERAAGIGPIMELLPGEYA